MRKRVPSLALQFRDLADEELRRHGLIPTVADIGRTYGLSPQRFRDLVYGRALTLKVAHKMMERWRIHGWRPLILLQVAEGSVLAFEEVARKRMPELFDGSRVPFVM